MFATYFCSSHKICIRFVAADTEQAKCRLLHLQAPVAAIARARHQRDHSALEHACTDAAAASHGRLRKSPPAVIDSHVADHGTTKDLRAHEGSDTGRRLLRLQAAGLDELERRI